MELTSANVNSNVNPSVNSNVNSTLSHAPKPLRAVSVSGGHAESSLASGLPGTLGAETDKSSKTKPRDVVESKKTKNVKRSRDIKDEDEEEEDEEEEDDEESEDDDENDSIVVSSEEEVEEGQEPESDAAKLKELHEEAMRITGGSLNLPKRQRKTIDPMNRFGVREKIDAFEKDDSRERLREILKWSKTPELAQKAKDCGMMWPKLKMTSPRDEIVKVHQQTRRTLGLESSSDEEESDEEMDQDDESEESETTEDGDSEMSDEDDSEDSEESEESE
jgi:hypothetical protein